MRRLIRSCAVYAVLLALAAVVIGGVYYFFYKPLLPNPQQLTGIEQLIVDPRTSVEQLREVAADGHKTIVTNLKVLDAAILVLVILCGMAAAGFAFIGIGMRRAGAERPGQA